MKLVDSDSDQHCTGYVVSSSAIDNPIKFWQKLKWVFMKWRHYKNLGPFLPNKTNKKKGFHTF